MANSLRTKICGETNQKQRSLKKEFLTAGVILDPQGFMFFSGYESYRNYFKEGLDKLGIDVHLFKVGEYKSAAEPFVRNDMSLEAKESTLYFMNDLWATFIENISNKRDISAERLKEII